MAKITYSELQPDMKFQVLEGFRDLISGTELIIKEIEGGYVRWETLDSEIGQKILWGRFKKHVALMHEYTFLAIEKLMKQYKVEFALTKEKGAINIHPVSYLTIDCEKVNLITIKDSEIEFRVSSTVHTAKERKYCFQHESGMAILEKIFFHYKNAKEIKKKFEEAKS